MTIPAAEDTIVAVSSDWQASPLGIIRLSGPKAFELAGKLGAGQPPNQTVLPATTAVRLRLHGALSLPATAFWFRAPRSYTGQDLVELHTVGSLPLLRELCDRLIEFGARRALPGEFTARGLVSGRLAPAQVEGVLALMQAGEQADLRQAARLARGERNHAIGKALGRLTELLAQIEASIDFVDEEDIHPVTSAEVMRTLDEVRNELEQWCQPPAEELRRCRPHVAVAGLPGAGKSTLFNALVGFERALVSPVLGTTRDVLSAETQLGPIKVVLQDCAGLGGSSDELELASHLASEQAAQQADLILWVHPADRRWERLETSACSQIEPRRRILVISKIDQAPAGRSLSFSPADAGSAGPPLRFAGQVAVCALTGAGLDKLRALVAEQLSRRGTPAGDPSRGGELRAAISALDRARDWAARTEPYPSDPELIALELRTAYELLTERPATGLDEQLLEQILTQFCVGK